MSAHDLTPFRRLIDQVVPRARPHFATIFPSIAAPVVVLNVLVVLVQRQVMLLMGAGDPTEGLAVIAAFLVLVVLMVGVFLVAFTALSVAANDAVVGRQVSMRRAWISALSPGALWTMFLVMLAGGLSLMMCLVPALVVMPLIALALPVMVEEKQSGAAAIARSASLAWWNGDRRLGDSPFFRVAAMLFIGWAVQNAIGLLAQGPFLAVQQYFILRDAAGGITDPAAAMGPLWLQLCGQVLGALATAVSWFYWAFGFAMLYHELRRRREANDLRQTIEQLIEQPSLPPTTPAPTAA